MDSRQMQHENAGNNRLSALILGLPGEPVAACKRERTYINNVPKSRGRSREEWREVPRTLCIFMNYYRQLPLFPSLFPCSD